MSGGGEQTAARAGGTGERVTREPSCRPRQDSEYTQSGGADR